MNGTWCYMDDKKAEERRKLALDYHSMGGRPGKIEVCPTKPCITARDLSLAYTPGVATPCEEIAQDPKKAALYTAKNNLVAVVTNGSAVLGLGNIGPLAAKPVMEGKGILFKRFAGIDVFDIEIKAPTVEEMVSTISALEPTFGGINLEDIKAPECFEVERQLIEKMNIPIFHDDQHGTAIIAAASLINALEVAKKKIGNIKIVFNGAGAAAMACARLFFDLGASKENFVMCDSKGVLYKGRAEGMNPYKEEFAVETKAHTLREAMKGADVFIGLSQRGVLSKEMVEGMAATPIIFAMANPYPEIYPDEVRQVRQDAIMATGRSDFPNQVNNVLGFPFIFRGALDVHATQINKQMKLAAVHALANLAREEVPEDVRIAYNDQEFHFGPHYIIPKPFDKRVLTRVSPAVAEAAMESGVARIHIESKRAYALSLEGRLLEVAASFMKSLRDRLNAYVAKTKKKVCTVFASGSNTRILNAVSTLLLEEQIDPILLGDRSSILKKMDELGLGHLKEIPIIQPETDKHLLPFVEKFHQERQRKGVSKDYAQELMKQANYFGAMMVREGLADTLISGPAQTYPECFVPMMNVIGTHDNSKAAGIFILNFKDRIIFCADCTAQIDPGPEDLSVIALSTAKLYEELLGKRPRVAFLSFSNFGSTRHPQAQKMQKAVELTKKQDPHLIVDGEIQADVAVNKMLMEKLFKFSQLDEAADVLIFPNLNAANISYKLLSQLSDAIPIGPILVPMKNAVNIIQRTTTVTEIINMSILTAILLQRKGDSLV